MFSTCGDGGGGIWAIPQAQFVPFVAWVCQGGASPDTAVAGNSNPSRGHSSASLRKPGVILRSYASWRLDLVQSSKSSFYIKMASPEDDVDANWSGWLSSTPREPTTPSRRSCDQCNRYVRLSLCPRLGQRVVCASNTAIGRRANVRTVLQTSRI